MTETFHPLTVRSTRRLGDAGIEIVFDVPADLATAFAFKPGQHLVLRTNLDGVSTSRTYSICSGSRGPLRIGIRHVGGGAFSSWANTRLAAGHSIEVAPAAGRFTLPPVVAPGRHLLMLAAGAGITPILGMTIEALETEPDTRVTLVYGARTAASTMFLSELEDLKDRFPTRFDFVPVFSRPGESEVPLLSGRVTGAKLKELAAKRIAIADIERAFLCGPGDFIKENRNALFEMGLPRERMHHEFFVGRTGATTGAASRPVPAPTATADVRTITMTAILDGQRHAFPIAAGQHVLDAALAAGVHAPHSCTAGMCSTCRARVVEGSVTMTNNFSLEDWELARGFVLTCQAVPTSDTLTVDYDAM